MAYTVRIKNNTTGEIRNYDMDSAWDDNQEFFWTEGNYGCDCNRDLAFQRAVLPEDKIDWSATCGENKYTVIDATLPDGSIVSLSDS